MAENHDLRITASGRPRNGLPHPTSTYTYRGNGHDAIDPSACQCGESFGGCPHARQIRNAEKKTSNWKDALPWWHTESTSDGSATTPA